METPRHWRTQSARYALCGIVCSECGKIAFPPRQLCPQCHAQTVKPYRCSGLGEVYSYSTVRQAPDGFAGNVPYVVALIRLAEGPLVAAQLTDLMPNQVEIGLRVEMVTRRLRDDGPEGIVIYGYKFRPLMSATSA